MIAGSTAYRPGGECGNGPPTGKFMGKSGLGQFWGAEFENRWYTGIGRGLQPRFRDSMSRFGEIHWCAIEAKNKRNFDE